MKDFWFFVTIYSAFCAIHSGIIVSLKIHNNFHKIPLYEWGICMLIK